MIKRKWTKEEIGLLWSNKTNKEIAEETGRNFETVRRMRKYYTGFSSEKRYTREDMALAYSEARIITLARKLGVRIEGVR